MKIQRKIHSYLLAGLISLSMTSSQALSFQLQSTNPMTSSVEEAEEDRNPIFKDKKVIIPVALGTAVTLVILAVKFLGKQSKSTGNHQSGGGCCNHSQGSGTVVIPAGNTAVVVPAPTTNANSVVPETDLLGNETQTANPELQLGLDDFEPEHLSLSQIDEEKLEQAKIEIRNHLEWFSPELAGLEAMAQALELNIEKQIAKHGAEKVKISKKNKQKFIEIVESRDAIIKEYQKFEETELNRLQYAKALGISVADFQTAVENPIFSDPESFGIISQYVEVGR